MRELWPSQAELPYEERELPLHFAATVPNEHRSHKAYRIGVTRKIVLYERAHPEIRLVLFLDPPTRDGETWQPIVRSHVQRDRGVDPQQSRQREERLWAEICQVERRGRPRGTGHPKKRIVKECPISGKDIDRLRGAGLDDRDLRIFFGRWTARHLSRSAESLEYQPRRLGTAGREGSSPGSSK